MIEAHPNRNGVVFTKGNVILNGSKIVMQSEAHVASGPLSNGQFFTVLKILSHPEYTEIISGSKIPSELECSEREIRSTCEQLTQVSTEKSMPRHSTNPLQQMWMSEEELVAPIVKDTAFTAEQVLEIRQLIDSGKTLGATTVAYMFDIPEPQVHEVLGRIAESFGYNYENGKIVRNQTKRGLELLLGS